MTKNILITGSTGFIGKALVNELNIEYNIRVVVRKRCEQFDESLEQIILSKPIEENNWTTVLGGIDTVIHLAARVHIMDDVDTNPLEAFRQVNTVATLNLARQASALGVRRFIYLSSIKVNGENTVNGLCFSSNDNNVPTDPYGLSKYEAEQGLRVIAIDTGIEVVIIRPPLVYGPHVKGNFKKMMNWLHKGVPLPFGLVYNRRSLVALENLIDLIVTCISHPDAANQIFLVSDDEDISTTELLERLANGLGKPARLLPIPVIILTTGATILGKRSIAQRLFGSLQVDITHTKSILGWSPAISVDSALKKTADAYREALKT